MPSPQVILFARAISRLVGWIYTIAWSLSFYPQPILNLRRRSTVGTTPSFPTLNVLGFNAYFLSTSAFYFSPLIRAQYAARNPVSPEPPVQGNDVVFAGHSVVLTVTLTSMYFRRIWGFDQDGERQGIWRVGKVIWGICAACVLSIIWTVGLVLIQGEDSGKNPERWAWIDVAYVMGYVKLVVTTVKYMPQVVTNYRRKSTTGWSIQQIILDAIGGVFSIAQLLIDCSLQGDWSGIAGNSTKLALGYISLLFDSIFLVQHYIIYRGNDKPWNEERSELLVEDAGSTSHNS